MSADADNGGPAFPVIETTERTAGDHNSGYTTIPDVYSYGGMTLRDYFAIRASEQDIDNHRDYTIDPVRGHRVYITTIERAKYAYADAMISARSEP